MKLWRQEESLKPVEDIVGQTHQLDIEGVAMEVQARQFVQVKTQLRFFDMPLYGSPLVVKGPAAFGI